MLRWRLFGISFAITPGFWLMNALWAYLLYEPITRQNRAPDQLFTRELLYLMLIWILCMFVTVMVHELGHAIMGRLFGQPGAITLTGMGGQAVTGYEELSPWKRIMVVAAGPGAGFLFVLLITLFDGTYWNWCVDWLVANAGGLFWENFKCNVHLIDWFKPGFREWGGSLTYRLVMVILFSLSLFMNIVNLLPIIPMDGGMIFKEICCLVSPRGGLLFAFVWSFMLATLLTLYLVFIVMSKYEFYVDKQYQSYYPFAFPEFSLLIFASLAYQSFRTYRQISATQRHSDYMQDDDDSGPRRMSHGVVEIPPKDPRDFAPRAPGSERPRL